MVNDLLAGIVVGVRFTAIDDLQSAKLSGHGQQSFSVLEQQICPLIRGRAASKADGEDVGIEPLSGAIGDRLEEPALALSMCCRNFRRWNVDGVAEEEIIGAPPGDWAVEQSLHSRTGPGCGV